jgi:predicted RNase H-like HicB family nuclease
MLGKRLGVGRGQRVDRAPSSAAGYYARARLPGMQFEVEVYRKDTGEWIATAVEHGVSATGRTETEALARVMEALSTHFKSAPKPGATSR